MNLFESIIDNFKKKEFELLTSSIDKDVFKTITEYAFKNIAFHHQCEHIKALDDIINSSVSGGDKFIASLMKENAFISSKYSLPLCQDTGVASVYAFIGCESKVLKYAQNFNIDINSAIASSYTQNKLRNSINKPSSLTEEEDTKNNTPGDINLYLQDKDPTSSYFLFTTKGGGSSNKTKFFTKTKTFLNTDCVKGFLQENISSLGTSACPPYRLSFVVGGLTPEENLTALKLASCVDFQNSEFVLRDKSTEELMLSIAAKQSIGLGLGGEKQAVGATALRLPRHGASVFVSFGLSCSSERNMLLKITDDGIWAEKLYSFQNEYENTEFNEYLKDNSKIIRYSGPLVVARDKAHNFWMKHNIIPEYTKLYPIFYAGPTEAKEGFVSGSIGPTTSSRMDEGAIYLMKRGASFMMVGKGERSSEFYKTAKETNSSYYKVLGGIASFITQKNIISSKIIDNKEFGMEAVRLLEVKDLLLIKDNF